MRDDVVAVFCALAVGFGHLHGKKLPTLTEQNFRIYISLFPFHLICIVTGYCI